MKYVPFGIPAADRKCRVLGQIYESDNPADLGEDMLEVSLSNGILVCAGWYPEGDPQGKYAITVTKGMQHVIDPKETVSALEAVEIVRECVMTIVQKHAAKKKGAAT